MQTEKAPIFVARHAETVFNRAARMQGNNSHTPLTRAGFVQADAMGAALADHAARTGERPAIWTSPAGRTRQTASIIAEHLDMSFFDIQADARLREIEVGRWTGRNYADIVAEEGDIFDREHRLFRMPVEGGEHYRDVAERLAEWLAGLDRTTPVLAISHGMTARVLRGLLTGGRDYHGVLVAPDVPQGSVVRITGETETLLFTGSGASGVQAV
ncbi:MAG: histidine phosphatase family protein [Sphingomonadaceae bacterium]